MISAAQNSLRTHLAYFNNYDGELGKKYKLKFKFKTTLFEQ